MITKTYSKVNDSIMYKHELCIKNIKRKGVDILVFIIHSFAKYN